VADQNESRDDADTPGTADTPVPDVVDAEVVGESPPPPRADTTISAEDAEKFRQYQQFLDFQKFQEWQRQQGDTAAQRAARPWWKRLLFLLRYKFVRRLLYFVIIIILIAVAINHFFGGSSQSSAPASGVPGNDNPAVSPVQGKDPKDVITAVYTYVSADDPTVTCALFSPQGRGEFAAANNAPDCATATHQLATRVTDANAYVDFGFNRNSVTMSPGQAEVSACDVTVTGGPRLGSFHLQQLPNGGWQIDGYQNAPAHCPPS
jgi:hypothetical protein